MELLSPDMDVVAYDRRGFGATTYRAERHDQVVDLLGRARRPRPGRGRAGRQLAGRPDRPGLHADPSRTGRRRWSWSPRPSRARRRSTTRRSTRSRPPSGRPSRRLMPPGRSTPSTSARSGSGSTVPMPPRGGSAAPLRELALDMNRIALHAAEPRPRARAARRLVAPLRGALPRPGGGGRPRSASTYRSGAGSWRRASRARASRSWRGRPTSPASSSRRRSPSLLRGFLGHVG